MSPELIAIVAVGIALAGIVLRGQRTLGDRIDGVEKSLNARMDRLEARMDGFQEELREIRDWLSRLEGKMDFLEGYIVRRNEHPGAPAE